jgi:hypothetical protein
LCAYRLGEGGEEDWRRVGEGGGTREKKPKKRKDIESMIKNFSSFVTGVLFVYISPPVFICLPVVPLSRVVD